MLDFVNPVFALWWLIDQGRKLWLDKSETRMEYAKHGILGRLTEEARTVEPGPLPLTIRREVMAGDHHHCLTTIRRRLINLQGNSTPKREATKMLP